jgi:hypothetical protein
MTPNEPSCQLDKCAKRDFFGLVVGYELIPGEAEMCADGTQVNPASGGATNWPPPNFNPRAGAFYGGTTP